MPTRRELLSAAAAMPAAMAQVAPLDVPREAVERNDERVDALLKFQVTDPASPNLGCLTDAYGLHPAQPISGLVESATAALLHAGSRHHRSAALRERLLLGARALRTRQNAQGNIDLYSTNFNSPPDTGFVTHNVATGACLALRAGDRELVAALEPFLVAAGRAMAVGGVHTPNHRWAVSSALAQVNEVFPRAEYVRRIDQWLAEGIDIDEDGQFTERSTTVYNPVTDRAFVVLAEKLKRPELLEPVRRNLQSLLYLLHPGYEVVTDISRRQDQFERGDIGRHWFPLQYMAVQDRNGQFATLARHCAPLYSTLSALMEYPMVRELVEPMPVPDQYERHLRAVGIARVRRGKTSATVTLGGSSRFFSLRRGEAAIQAVRFASAFFGKGQFVPTETTAKPGRYTLAQELAGPYYQPFDPPRQLHTENWNSTREERRQSEVCRLRQSAVIEERPDGFVLTLEATGTPQVPVAVEISLRPGGTLAGCSPVANSPDAWLLSSAEATYRIGEDTLRITPGKAEHRYVQVRGAEAKLPGTSVYLTGVTPFRHALRLGWG